MPPAHAPPCPSAVDALPGDPADDPRHASDDAPVAEAEQSPAAPDAIALGIALKDNESEADKDCEVSSRPYLTVDGGAPLRQRHAVQGRPA